MYDPAEPTPSDEAIAYRLVLMGIHADDPMGYSAIADMFDGGEQRVVNVTTVLAGLALNVMRDAGTSEDRIVEELRRLVAEKTLESEGGGSIS